MATSQQSFIIQHRPRVAAEVPLLRGDNKRFLGFVASADLVVILAGSYVSPN